MASKAKTRLFVNENKLLKLENLQLKDVNCSICQSILIEPITLPCYHDFCKACFTGTIENNSLCCPLCRLRIGSWLRYSTKQKNLVNIRLWNFLKSKFQKEIDLKIRGIDVVTLEEKPVIRLSEPGEIKAEYEAELQRVTSERLSIEQKQFQESEILIKKIQEEEEEAHRSKIEILENDELLAKRLQQDLLKDSLPTVIKQTLRRNSTKFRLKNYKIDDFLTKMHSSKYSKTANSSASQQSDASSPEVVPSYTKTVKALMEQKEKNNYLISNKENGKILKKENTRLELISTSSCTTSEEKTSCPRSKGLMSLPVSLPYTGILRNKVELENRNLDTGSVDSMNLELCYFKPIDGKTPTSFTSSKSLPQRVPGLKIEVSTPPPPKSTPSQTQYLEGLCQLRSTSLVNNLPSAFVITENMLRIMKDILDKRKSSDNSTDQQSGDLIKNTSNTELNCISNARRTRSMGCGSKSESESTPKKAKIEVRKVSSERKPYLRSDSKKYIDNINAVSTHTESENNNKVDVHLNGQCGSLEISNVEMLYKEQLRIEKMIEQEKSDFEYAKQLEGQLNGRRQLRRPVKRQITLNYALKPVKKLKVQ